MKSKSTPFKARDSLAKVSTHFDNALEGIREAKDLVENNHKELEEEINGERPFNRRVVPYPWENRVGTKKRKLPPE